MAQRRMSEFSEVDDSKATYTILVKLHHDASTRCSTFLHMCTIPDTARSQPTI
jgi:hypothetical protein